MEPEPIPEPHSHTKIPLDETLLSSEHDYWKPASKKRKLTAEETETKIYNETLEELREIRYGVEQINKNLGGINQSLKKIANILFVPE